MRMNRRIFIGFDSRRVQDFNVTYQSLMDVGVDQNMIYALRTDVLRRNGLYWRDDDSECSTEFTNTRFLVPYLSGYYGVSMFCDSDFLWRRNPEPLFEMIEQSRCAVRVVKHNIKPEQLTAHKMEGIPQKWYERKNWSSLMLFRNDHHDCAVCLRPETISSTSSKFLHQFHWTDMNRSESLPLEWNYLAGYGIQVNDPAAVHFTDGTPRVSGYENSEYSEEWLNVEQRFKDRIRVTLRKRH